MIRCYNCGADIENDVVGKYVEKLLQPRENAQAKSPQAGSITMAFLQENGF